ncbi:MAG: ATP-binding protein [Lachnospiraceae bacterium]|nr:ATP-binding protein [Lachnospiraceae bacterium]
MNDDRFIQIDKEKVTDIMLSLFDFIYANKEKMIIFSDRISDAFGIPKQITGAPESFMDQYIHPDYHGCLREIFDKADNGERKAGVEVQDINKEHWFKIVLETAEKDENGRANFTVGTFDGCDDLHTFKTRAGLMQEISKIAITDHYVRVFMLDLYSGSYSYFNQNGNDEEAWVSRDFDNSFDEYIESYSALAADESDKEAILSLKTDVLCDAIKSNGGQAVVKYRVIQNDKLIWYKVECSFFKGDTGRILGLISDITEDEENSEKLKKAMLSAESANKAKSTFLANMSHEIRTPMNAIIGISEILLSKDLSPDVRNDVSTIQNAGTGLLAIINDILDFSKIESGRFEIIPVDYMLPSMLMDISNMISVRLSDKPVNFLMNVDPVLPNHITGDDIRIRQILMNLLGNAVKFTKEGHISLNVEGAKTGDDEWTLVFKISDTGIGIKPEDIGKLFGTFSQVDTKKNRAITGSGLGLAISKNFAEMMGGGIEVASEYGKGSTFTVTIKQEVKRYEPLGKVDNSGSIKALILESDEVIISSLGRSLEKLGIEYRICRDFDKIKSFTDMTHVLVRRKFYRDIKAKLEFMFEAGNIYLILEKSEPALGEYMSHKQLQLPLAGIQMINAFNNREVVSSYKKHGFDRSQIVPLTFARVLVVDDNTTNLQVAKGLMAPYKMNIDMASSGYKAIELLKNLKYDIIFMDHMMPEMDGVETTEFIRKMDGEYYKKVPIVALTANAMSDAKDMFLSSGFTDFIAKPIEMSELNRVLKAYVQCKAPSGYIEKILNERSSSNHASASGEKKSSPVSGTAPAVGGNSFGPETVTALLTQNNMLLAQNMKLLNSLIPDQAADMNVFAQPVSGDVRNISGSKDFAPVTNDFAPVTNNFAPAMNTKEVENYNFRGENPGIPGDGIPDVNTTSALELYGGDADIYLSILKTFVKDIKEKCQVMKEQFETGDIDNLVISAHAVKSAAAGIGADSLSMYALDLENAGKIRDTDSVELKFASFMDSAVKIRDSLESYFREYFPTNESDESKPYRESFDEADIEALKNACADMDYEKAGETLKQMAAYRYMPARENTLNTLVKYCAEFEYDKLEQLINEL